MAEMNDRRWDEGEALLRRLQRLLARARVAKTGDRAQLLALLDDVQTVRCELASECARLDDEIKRGSVRITAIRAYAWGASAIRAPRQSGH